MNTLLCDVTQGNQNHRFLQIEREFLRYNLDIMGLSEIRWLGSGEYRSPTGSTVLLYSGKEMGSTHESGVGLLITPQTRQSIISWQPVSDRIISARFQSKMRNITIIQCYAPTENATQEKKDDFYNQLTAVYNNTPRGDIIIVMGDLNAKVGSVNDSLKHVMGKHGLGSRNDNGERFVEFCSMNQLVIGGTMFQHKACHKVSWVSNDRQRTSNQIDHFAISRRFRSCLLDVRNRRGADNGLVRDHHLMSATLRLRVAAIRRNNNSLRVPKYNIDKLKVPSIRSGFKEELQHRREAISNQSNSNMVEWDSVKNAFREAGDAVIGKIPRGHKPWMSEGTWDKIEDRRRLKAQIVTADGSDDEVLQAELNAQYRAMDKEVKRSVRRDKRNHINNLAEKAEHAAHLGDSSLLYKITKTLVKGNLSTQHPVRDVNGNLLHSDEEELQRWREHFSSVLNNFTEENAGPDTSHSSAETNSRIRTNIPSLEDITAAIKALPNNKAAGIDGIPAEFYKVDPAASAEMLLPLITSIWENETFPSEWKNGIIVKIPKKGNLTECNNWRGICVLPTVTKIITKIILNRLKEHLEISINEEQAGFRAGSSCTDHINTVRIIIEQCVEFRSPLHLMFVDFEKAFDSVRRDQIWAALRRRGVPQKIIAIIKASYNGASCRVLHKGKLTEPFDVCSGVRQGCILSPLLFLLVIGDILRVAFNDTRGGIMWTMNSFLKHLDYADDVCLLSHRIMDLAQLAHSLELKAGEAGLKINGPKTKIISLSNNTRAPINIAGHAINTVESFTYLGSIVTADGGTEADITSRINKAKGAFGMMSTVWRNNNISLRTKLKLFNSTVKSVLLYGCTTWKVTATITSKLQVFINRCLRRILRIFWPNTISNEDLWRKTGQVDIGTLIRRRKWEWIGHTLRKPDDNIAKKALRWNPITQSGRTAGRPRQTWRRTVDAEVREHGYSWAELNHIAKNRVRWRGIVDALCPTRGHGHQ